MVQNEKPTNWCAASLVARKGSSNLLMKRYDWKVPRGRFADRHGAPVCKNGYRFSIFRIERTRPT